MIESVKKRLNSNSIIKNLSIFLSSVIIVVGLIAGFADFYISARQMKTELRQYAQSETLKIADITAPSLWNFNESSLKLIASSLLSSKDIVGIQIVDHKKRLVLDIQEDTEYSLAFSEPIHYQKSQIGLLTLFFSQYSLEEKKDRMFFSSVSIIFCITVVCVFLIRILLKKYLDQELLVFGRAIDTLSRGDYKSVSINQGKIEFKTIIQSFLSMAKQLGAREEDLRQKTESMRQINLDLTQEIQERKKKVEELKEKEIELIKFKQFAEHSTQGFGIGALDGKINYINQTLANLIGKEKDEYIKEQSIVQYYPPKIQKQFEQEILPEVIKFGKWQGELIIVNKNGKETPTFENFFIIKDDNGVPMYLADIISDITEKKKAEGELKHYQDSLVELVKMRTEQLESINTELTDFAYVVSHDLKAPLRGIISIAGWLKEDYSEQLDGDGVNYLDKLVLRTQRMHNLIEGILQYSRVGQVDANISQFNSQVIVKQVIIDVSPPESFVINIEDSLPEIHYDKTLFGQVLQNIIDNAIKHHGKESGNISISCKEQKDVWEFCITDDGIGIDDKQFDRIFKLFQKLSSSKESTGVGLALVKKIVEKNGGKIWLNSAVGKGSSFYFTVLKRNSS
jgi:PAS domain S-box-containing protein